MSDTEILTFLRACVEDSAADLRGYYEAHRSVEPDLSEHDTAIQWLDAALARTRFGDGK